MRRLTASWRAVRRHRGQKGQTLIIMAFLSIFMITLLGLVIDSVRLYVLAAQAERAAEAAALAGALYMPTYFSETSPAPDGQSAEKRACDVLQQNGITACLVSPGQVGGMVSTVPTNQYEVEVTVTLRADVFFLAFISPNLSSATVSRSALAQFLPPIELGSRTSYFGDQADSVQSFWASINGPQNLQEQGDAYSPTWQEGPTDPQLYPDGGSFKYSRWGGTVCCTNHQQWPTPITNPYVQPTGFTGYNYQIVVPAGSGPIQVQIYNPAFINGSTSTYPNTTSDSLLDATNDPTFGGKTDQKNEYTQMNYNLYSSQLLFERTTDTLLTTTPFQPPSLDFADAGTHGCGSQAWDPQAQACTTSIPSYINNWYTLYTIPNSLTLGIYRLSVAATVGYGSKNYGVRLTTSPSSGSPPAGVHIFAWNNMCVYFDVAGGSTGLTSTFDLGEIPAAYAGKTLNFSLFDPGEGNKNIDIKILDPSGNPVQLPSWLRTTSGGTDLEASINGDNIYNGLWLNMPIAIPATYNPAAGSDWWQISYTNNGSSVHDKITISISLSGSPIHLVNEIP